MKKEQLTALGVPEDKIQGILDLVKEETKDMIPKFRFDELTTAKNSLTEQLKTANSEIEKLKKFEGTNTELQTKITEIQKDLNQKETEYKEGLQKLAKNMLPLKNIIEGTRLCFLNVLPLYSYDTYI